MHMVIMVIHSHPQVFKAVYMCPLQVTPISIRQRFLYRIFVALASMVIMSPCASQCVRCIDSISIKELYLLGLTKNVLVSLRTPMFFLACSYHMILTLTFDVQKFLLSHVTIPVSFELSTRCKSFPLVEKTHAPILCQV